MRWHDDATPEDAMQLVLAAKLPRLGGREAAAMDELMKARGCGARTTGVERWGPFVVPCSTKVAAVP